MTSSSARKGVVDNLLHSKKNTYSYQSSHIYHSFLFCCDRFRDVFRLPQFSCHDLDAALNLESENFRAGSKTLEISDLIRKIVIAICKPFGRPNVTQTNYNEVVHYLIEKKYVTEKNSNFLGPLETANLHSLPSEVKLFLLNFLLDLRIQKDESETVDTYCDASALRVLELGMDTGANKYFYFGEFRIVIELRQKQVYHHLVDDFNLKTAIWKTIYERLTSNCQFLIVAENEDQWKALIEAFEMAGKLENKMVQDLINLQKSEVNAYLIEMEKRELMKIEELKKCKKNEISLRKELGLVRSSGRLQVKEIEKRIKEEEELKAKEEKERLAMEEAIANGTYLKDRLQRAKTRAERHLHREAVIASAMLAEDVEKVDDKTTAESNVIVRKVGYRLLKRESTDEEERGLEDGTDDEQIGAGNEPREKLDQAQIELMEVLHDHLYYTLRPPHLVPCSRDHSSDTNGSLDEDRNLALGETLKKKKRVSFASYEPTRNDGNPIYEPIPFFERIEALQHMTIREYYSMFASSKVKISHKDYTKAMLTAHNFFYNEFSQTQNNLRIKNEPWNALDQFCYRLGRHMLDSKIEIIMELELLSQTIGSSQTRGNLIVGMFRFASLSWDILFPECSKENESAKDIMRQILFNLEARGLGEELDRINREQEEEDLAAASNLVF